MFYAGIVDKMNKACINYAIVGGVAANLHGYIRMTADLDLILELDRDNISAAITLLLDEGFQCKRLLIH